MKKTIYLHIGYHKTGTTAIQQSLYNHHELLKEQGYFYPIMGGKIGHHNIAWELQSMWKFSASEGNLQDLLVEIKQNPNSSVIISSERLSRLTRDQIEKLAHAFMNYDVKVIVYLRRQDQLLQSIWSQTVKNGKEKRSFAIWLDEMVFNYAEDNPAYKNSEHKLNYSLTITEWAEVFGEENIRVRVYDKLIKNILKDFLTACDMQDMSWVPEPDRNNVSPSIKTLETIRLISNPLLSLPQDILRGSAYPNLIQKMRIQANELGWNTEKLNLVTPEIYSQIIDPLTESNNEVAHKYLGRNTLFVDDPVSDEISSFDIKSLNVEELIEVLSPALEEIVYQASLVSRSEVIKHRARQSQEFPEISDFLIRHPRLSNYLEKIIRRLGTNLSEADK